MDDRSCTALTLFPNRFFFQHKLSPPAPEEEPRIVNGYEAAERPWMVHIQIKGVNPLSGEVSMARCGGSIINKR